MKVRIIGANAPEISILMAGKGFRNVKPADKAYSKINTVGNIDSMIIYLAGPGMSGKAVPEADYVIRTDFLTPEETANLCAQYICGTESAARIAYKLKRSKRICKSEAAKERQLSQAFDAWYRATRDGEAQDSETNLKLRETEDHGFYVGRKRNSLADRSVKQISNKRMRCEGKRMARSYDDFEGLRCGKPVSTRNSTNRKALTPLWRKAV